MWSKRRINNKNLFIHRILMIRDFFNKIMKAKNGESKENHKFSMIKINKCWLKKNFWKMKKFQTPSANKFRLYQQIESIKKI